MWQSYLPEARAVISAIREPSEVMIKRGEAAAWDDANHMPAVRAVPAAWSAMIDTMLEEKP
ncbi:hypothetical protein YP76_04140 [Sphingobium chungbukense]|uniref:Uncharacterized protein n=2 Tax=Sphingobium chungbukense TaxID=56193 RepID=A0A0M3AY65_9SPHN|nr:hypothetical protein YP76_04140 [Sphingobium chungbukense]